MVRISTLSLGLAGVCAVQLNEACGQTTLHFSYLTQQTRQNFDSGLPTSCDGFVRIKYLEQK